MPSGISHMLLSRNLPIADDSSYRYKQLYNTRYFQIGSIAPDLPYGAIADNNFLENENKFANLFHFTEVNQSIDQAPNRLPLLGLNQVKNLLKQGSNKRACDALFWFLAGYASHVIADGICHPFVMDKVGRYEGQNKTEHRALEMGIDVLLFKHFTAGSGHAIEASYAGMDSLIVSFNELSHTNLILEHFSDLIEEVYGLPVAITEIKEWVNGISRLFSLATGKWPDWFRQLDATTPFVFKEISDLEGHETDYLVLGKPKNWENNFLNTVEIQLINDCLPHFNKLMKLYLHKAYAFVYESGPELVVDDLPAFSLDTGRSVNAPNTIEITPILWEVA